MNAIDRMRRDHVASAAKARAASEKALAITVAKLEKKFGKDVFTSFSSAVRSVRCLPTGYPHLDDLLTGEARKGSTIAGTGAGVPFGKVIELAGREGSGKTTLCLHIAKAFQQAGYRVGFVDAEHAVDVAYARRIGVDVDALLFSQPSSAEEALDVVDYLVKGAAANLVIEDSVAALTPEAELDGDMGDQHIGLQARLMGKALRKIKANAADNGATVLFVNQLRQKIGGFSRFGPTEVTTGGNALRFFADIRLDMRVIRTIKKGTKSVGLMSRLRCVKNKVAPPFRDAYVELEFGVGVANVWPSDDADAKAKEKEESDGGAG